MFKRIEIMEEKLDLIFKELEEKAYNPKWHTYEFKEANQVIRKFFEALCPSRSKYDTFFYGWIIGVFISFLMFLSATLL